MTRVVVDFNDVRDGMIGALRRYVSGPVQAGDSVVATDEEAHEVDATVEHADDEAIDLRVDWSTWRSLSRRYDQAGGGWTTVAAPSPPQLVLAQYTVSTAEPIQPTRIPANAA